MSALPLALELLIVGDVHQMDPKSKLGSYWERIPKRHGQQSDLKKKKSLKTPQLWTRKLGGDSGHFGEGKAVGREKGKEDIYYNRWRSLGSLTRAFARY